MDTILLVEDSVRTQELVKYALNEEFELISAEDVIAAKSICSERTPKLIILDVNLTYGNGFEFFNFMKSKRNLKNVPVIFLTAKSSINDKTLAFNLGAEDYITKPFDPMELLLRVRARLSKGARSNIIVDNNLELNKSKQSVNLTKPDGNIENIDLTPIEFKLLLFFAENPDSIYSREQIFDQVWGENTYFLERTIDRHISSLRKKLGPDGNRLNTVYGSGYRWSSTPNEFRSAA